MYKTGIKLNHSDGSFCCYLTASALKTEIRKGNVRRAPNFTAKNPVYQKVPPPAPPRSKASVPTITIADMRKIVGEQRLEKDREEQDLERLIGFGLLPENTAVPANGYLR